LLLTVAAAVFISLILAWRRRDEMWGESKMEYCDG